MNQKVLKNEVKTPYLQSEMEHLQDALQRESGISQSELKEMLIRCVTGLSKYPISEYEPIDAIMDYLYMHHSKHYFYHEYIGRVNEDSHELFFNYQERMAGVVPEFNRYMYRREHMVILEHIKKNWNKLYLYEDTYIYLAELLRVYPLTRILYTAELVNIMTMLDKAVIDSQVKKALPMTAAASVKDMIDSLEYALSLYYTDNAYAYVCDSNDENVLERLFAHYKEMNHLKSSWSRYDSDEDYLCALKEYEKKCFILFKEFALHKKGKNTMDLSKGVAELMKDCIMNYVWRNVPMKEIQLQEIIVDFDANHPVVYIDKDDIHLRCELTEKGEPFVYDTSYGIDNKQLVCTYVSITKPDNRKMKKFINALKREKRRSRFVWVNCLIKEKSARIGYMKSKIDGKLGLQVGRYVYFGEKNELVDIKRGCNYKIVKTYMTIPAEASRELIDLYYLNGHDVVA